MKKLILLAILIFVFYSVYNPVEFKNDWECVKEYYTENALFRNIYVEEIQSAGLQIKDSIVEFLQPVVDVFSE